MVSTEQLQQLLETFRATGARSINIYPGNGGRLIVTIQLASDSDVRVTAAASGLAAPKQVTTPVVGSPGASHRWLSSLSHDVPGIDGVYLDLCGPHTVTLDLGVPMTEVQS